MALTVATAGTGVARTAHYVTPTGASAPIQTLLLEPQRTNLVLYSQDFDNAAWTKSNATITANTTTAPDGTTTADKLVENTANAQHRVLAVITVVAGVTHTMSFYVKADQRTRVSIFDNASAADTEMIFDLSNGTVVRTGTAVVASSITSLSGGWYRITASSTPTVTSMQSALRLVQSGTTSTYTGDGTSGLFLWGAQIEAGAVASSYIKTEGTTVTRNADSLYFPFTVPPQAMTVYVRGVNVGAYQSQTNAARVLHIGDINTGTDPRFSLVRNAGASQVQALYDDGVTLRSGNATPSPTPVLSDIIEHRGVLSSSWVPSSGISVNGGVEQTGTTTASGPATAWANPRLYIAGHADHDQFAYTHIAVVPGVQSMAEMRAIAGVS